MSLGKHGPWFTVVAVSSGLLAACSGGEAVGDPITAREVEARFEAEGIELSSAVIDVGDARLDGVLLRPTDNRILGDFSISVLASSADAKASLQGNPVWAREGPIYWYREILEQEEFAVAWAAVTRYDNVALGWFPLRKEVDERWRRLDRLLRDIQAQQRDAG